jgi:hypothetical protein
MFFFKTTNFKSIVSQGIKEVKSLIIKIFRGFAMIFLYIYVSPSTLSPLAF